MRNFGGDSKRSLLARRRLVELGWRLSIAEARRNSEMRQHDVSAVPLQPERPHGPDVKILCVDRPHDKKIPPAGD